MSYIKNDSIFWIEVEKIKPNPFQPRVEFDHSKLNSLSESIRQYGVLQPLVVTRKEEIKEDGGLNAIYELIAGERRLRASKLAGLAQVPVIIRDDDEDDSLKLELAIIENLQREDLNPIDRAKAFERLTKDFNLKHIEIGKKVGKSREYVSNTLRLLMLPEEMMQAVSGGQILEGHTRPILMLKDRPEEQKTLFKEILYKKLSVRDTEAIARRIAYDKVRKKDYAIDPELVEFEEKLAESLGTRVQIERKEVGGKVIIDFFTNDDIKKIISILQSEVAKDPNETLNNYENNFENKESELIGQLGKDDSVVEKNDDNEDDLYSLKDFSL
ncbi:MAG: ParB/RepB/Spo0J family partition protein [Candidatus Pacebacteria bacterium]|nr:ParB/RepB/Spo0J family partition protein [Candidatus Paceibacterota bacterium]